MTTSMSNRRARSTATPMERGMNSTNASISSMLSILGPTYLVHSQNRLSAKCYADRHETTDLRASAFGRRARGPGGRPALVRRLRPPSLPDPPCQLQGRERLRHSPLVGLRSPDGAHSHKALQRGGIEEALRKRSSRPERVHAAFDEGGTEALREMLHRSPREFGKDTSLWTLSLAAEVSFEEG